jgi:replication factor A1
VGEERRLLHEGILLDRSGTVSFTAWSDFGLVEGEPVRIVGGYVRAFRGRPQLVLDERCHVERWGGLGLPTTEEWTNANAAPIAAIEVARGADHAILEGVVVGVMPPSGVVYRCPTCRRSLSKGLCRLHGPVEGEADLRARIVLDDGTGAATINADRAATEQLWARTLADCLAQLRHQPDASALEGPRAESLFGRRLRVKGRAVADDFGLTVYPETIEPVVAPSIPDLADLERLTRSAGR